MYLNLNDFTSFKTTGAITCVCVCVCVCVFMSVFSSRNYKLLVFLLPLSFQNLQNGILYARMLYCCCYLVAQSCLTLLQPHGLKPTRLLYPWDSPGQEYWSGLPFLSPSDLLTEESTLVSYLAGGFFTTELLGKPRMFYK